jgi:uncharacterized integral membrane protein
MRIVRRIAFLVLILVIAATIFQNQESLGQTIGFHFLYWQKSLVLGFWIFLSFVAGGIVFLFLDTWRNIRLRWKLRSQEQQIAKLQADLAASGKTATSPISPSNSKP